MRKFYKKSTPDGYVVVMMEEHTVKPLRCFGWNQSAAIEFCDMLNNRFWERKDYQINGWAKTFDINKKFSYPKLTSTGIQLHR